MVIKDSVNYGRKLWPFVKYSQHSTMFYPTDVFHYAVLYLLSHEDINFSVLGYFIAIFL